MCCHIYYLLQSSNLLLPSSSTFTRPAVVYLFSSCLPSSHSHKEKKTSTCVPLSRPQLSTSLLRLVTCKQNSCLSANHNVCGRITQSVRSQLCSQKWCLVVGGRWLFGFWRFKSKSTVVFFCVRSEDIFTHTKKSEAESSTHACQRIKELSFSCTHIYTHPKPRSLSLAHTH